RLQDALGGPEQGCRACAFAGRRRDSGGGLEALGDGARLVQPPDDREALLDQRLGPLELTADHDRRGKGAKTSGHELRRPADASERERFFAALDRGADVSERKLDQAEIMRGGRGIEGRAELLGEAAPLLIEVPGPVEL